VVAVLFVVATLFAVWLTLAATAGCGSGSGGESSTTASPAAEVFKIGVAGPMSGPYSSYGASQRAGAEIAVAELNAAGGVNGAEVAVALADDRGEQDVALQVAQRFSADPQIMVVDGHVFSGTAIAAGAVYSGFRLPMISPSATDPALSYLGPYVWRVCLTDEVQGRALAEYSVSTIGKRRIAVLSVDTAYGTGLTAAFTSAVQAAGGVVAGRQTYAADASDFRRQLTKLKAAGPDLVFLAGYYNEGAAIARQARGLGLKAQLLGSDGYASDLLAKRGGAAVEGMLVATFFDPSRKDDAVRAFVAAYRELNDGAGPDWFAADSYDVVMLAAQAARDAGTNDRVAINDALTAIGSYQGVSGLMTFDENGDVTKPLSIVMVRKGTLVTAPRQPGD
jgi:branched-chain amino acid transport system substrate-binding protein